MIFLYIVGVLALCFYWYQRGFRDGEREVMSVKLDTTRRYYDPSQSRHRSEVPYRDTIGN